MPAASFTAEIIGIWPESGSMRAGRGYGVEAINGAITSVKDAVAKVGSVFYFTSTVKIAKVDDRLGRVPLTLIT